MPASSTLVERAHTRSLKQAPGRQREHSQLGALTRQGAPCRTAPGCSPSPSSCPSTISAAHALAAFSSASGYTLQCLQAADRCAPRTQIRAAAQPTSALRLTPSSFLYCCWQPRWPLPPYSPAAWAPAQTPRAGVIRTPSPYLRWCAAAQSSRTMVCSRCHSPATKPAPVQ